MVRRLVVVLGDQLSHDLSSLAAADPARDVVFMAELSDEAQYVPHHPKKIALVFSAMRHFAAELRDAGWQVEYQRYDRSASTGRFDAEVEKARQEHGCAEVILTEPGEWRLRLLFENMGQHVCILPDTRFIASLDEFAAWAEGRKTLRMEFFYREMRRKTGLLMDGDQPIGGAWNLDAQNRKSPPKTPPPNWSLRFEPDEITRDVLTLTQQEFDHHFGSLLPFELAVTRKEALKVLDQFIEHGLAHFGDYQDAMMHQSPLMYHSLVSSYLNIGLLNPLEICQRVQSAYFAGLAPLNAVEGYIRQIIGWREYMRGLYFYEGPDYVTRNTLGAEDGLPPLFWGAKTDMACLKEVISQTEDLGYAHHIQRLMIVGNFTLLAGINPQDVNHWFMSVYTDAYEWVVAPNVIGMSQSADGGIIASKPYVSSGAYINKMSNYCKSCAYKVSQKRGQGACPFNYLYWDFLSRHRNRFAGNGRMMQMYRVWDKMNPADQEEARENARAFRERLRSGERV